jgi:serine/threonine protein kinase
MNLVVKGNVSSYEVLEILGKGNFGVVNKVKDLKTNEIKALKRVKHSSMREEPKLKELIQSEIKIMSDMIKLNSKNPNIVKYYDDFEDKNYVNIVMEFCDGGDLRKYLQKVKKSKRLPEPEVLQICKDILNGFKGLIKIFYFFHNFFTRIIIYK